MPAVLTEKSTIECAHQGAVQAQASTDKLKIGGAKVLVEQDLNGKPISGCITVTDPNTSTLKCMSVTGTLPFGSKAMKLKVGGKAVLLQPIMGFTDGTASGMPQTWSVEDAGQTKLNSL